MAQATMYGQFEEACRVRTPIARRTDAESSHAAAAEITANGTLARQKQEVLNAVRKWPGRTSLELSALSGIDRYTIARRLKEIVEAGHVRRGRLRQCAVGERKALEWFPTESA